MVCELVFQTLTSCPGVKLLPAFLTSEFSGHMKDLNFILRSCSEIMYRFSRRADAPVLCVQICQKTPLLCFLLCSASAAALSFYRGGLGTENSNYAYWICSVRWFSVSCRGVRCCLWRLLKFSSWSASLLVFNFLVSGAVLELRAWTPVQKQLSLWHFVNSFFPWLCFETFVEFL